MQCFTKGRISEKELEDMAEERLQNSIGVKEKIIKAACHVAMRAHKRPEKPFIRRNCRSSKVIFAFPGTWSAGDWLPAETGTKHFGETQVDLEVFPSLKSIGNDEVATVNGAFLHRFLSVLGKPMFRDEVHPSVLQSFLFLSYWIRLSET